MSMKAAVIIIFILVQGVPKSNRQPHQPGTSGAPGNGCRSSKHGNDDDDPNPKPIDPKSDVGLCKGRGFPCSQDPSRKPVIQELYRETIPCSFKRNDASSPRMIDWMSNLPQSVTRKPLNEIAIPGSHNSFSYSITPTSDFVDDHHELLRIARFFKKIRFLETEVKNLIYRWSLTQNLNVTQQLQRGIRYLDCRVSWNSRTKSFHFIHGLYGGKVESCLRDVAMFLDRHPKEVVLLDFNHFYNMQFLHHNLLAAKLEDIFEYKIFTFKNDLPIQNISLQTLWKQNKQVIIFYHYGGNVVNKNGIATFWSGNLIRSPWPNTDNPIRLFDFLNHNCQDQGSDKIFYVLQGVLTYSMWTIICHFYSSLEEQLADITFSNQFNSWINQKDGISICIIDFVETSNFIIGLVALNTGS